MTGRTRSSSFNWQTFIQLVFAALSLVVPLLPVVKEDLRPETFSRWFIACLLCTGTLVFISLFPFIRERWSQRREKLAARAAEQEAAKALENATVEINRALKLVHAELPWGGPETTISGAATLLTCDLSCTEAASSRALLSEISHSVHGLPLSVEPTNARLIGQLLDRGVRRYVEHLPRYVEACEKAAIRLQAQDREWLLKRLQRFREQVNEFIRAYARIAERAGELLPNASPLHVFSSGAFLPQPVLPAVAS